MKLSTRLYISHTLLVVVTTVIVGLFARFGLERLIVPSELNKIQISAQQSGTDLSNEIGHTSQMVKALKSSPPIQAIIRARAHGGIDPESGLSENYWKEQLATIFQAHMHSNPDYLQIRFIGAADEGMEIVRVDKGGPDGSARVVPDEELLPKGHRDYFQQTIGESIEEVYISRIELNRENNQIEVPHKPTLRLATRVFPGNSIDPFGIIIINLDLRKVFSRTLQAPSEDSQIFLLNDEGDYLFHPNSSKTFGFEYGTPGILFSDFPDLSEYFFMEADSASTILKNQGVKTALIVEKIGLANQLEVYSLVSTPYASLVKSLASVRTFVLLAGAIASAVAIGFGLLLAKSFVSPIVTITKALENLRLEKSVSIPPSSSLEIEGLADAIEPLSLKMEEDRQALRNHLIEKAKAEAEAEARSMFLANMSHEIRTPMNGVIGITQMLLETPLNKEQKEFAEIIKRSSDMLLIIIDDILNFSKIDAGKIELEKVEFDPKSLGSDIINILQHQVGDRPIKLVANIDDELPDVVYGDPTRIRQVLFNLVSNAIKFTYQGQVELTISIQAQSDKDIRLRFEIQDTGIGIETQRIADLFDPFSQADRSTTRKFGGTGLGLAISKKLLALMGSEIQLSSRVGEGSTFWFDLQMEYFSKSQMQRIDALPLEALQSKSSVTPKVLNILVAEDNLINQKVIQILLDKLGHNADIVANGLEVLQALKANSYDLILMDCHMPEMDGYQTTEYIRSEEVEETRTIPIIALSASALPEDRARCLQVGMNEHIAKPINFNVLQKVLAAY